MPHDPTPLPPEPPEPWDDGACDHLPGAALPPIALPATTGGQLRVDQPPAGFNRLILYAYPKTGRPGVSPSSGWDQIPGARGCTSESCAFRDYSAEFAAAGAAVAGVSVQDTSYQAEAAGRLRLPFPLLSDTRRVFASALRLPTMCVDGEVLLRRFTLVIRDGAIEHVFYPVFPPEGHAEQILAWIAGH